MEPRHLIHFVWIGLLVSVFLTGCSIRAIPFEPPSAEEQAAYERDSAYYGSYYNGGYDSVPPEFSYNAWQMAQYYRYANEPSYAGYAYELGYLPPERMNIDPNPNDGYRADEVPIRQAPFQRSVQAAEAYRQSNRLGEGQQSSVSVQRAERRTRHEPSDSSTGPNQEKERDVQQQLKQRRGQSDDSSMTDEEREAQRRKVRQRARR